MTLAKLFSNYNVLSPEIILVLTICAVVVVDMLVSIRRSRVVCAAFSAVGILIALYCLQNACDLCPIKSSRYFFGETFIQDHLAVVLKAFFLVGTLICIWLAQSSRELFGYRSGEFFSLILGATLAACMLASVNHIVLLLLAFETLSLCSYVLAGSIKQNRPGAEAALKYLLYGAVSSSIMLFGFSFLYGLSGTLQIDSGAVVLVKMWLEGTNTEIIFLALLLCLCGIGFKIAMVPFHFWCPDVYQGSPTQISAFLSVISKGAGFAVLLRLASIIFEVPDLDLTIQMQLSDLSALNILLGLLALLTMTWGNLAALRQSNIKRLLGYSSIAHAGYMLLAFAVFDASAMNAALFYLWIYLFMNLGVFFIAVILIRETKSSEISAFNGLANQSPILFIVLFLFLISLTGLPPTAGFAAKLVLFQTVLARGLSAMNGAGLSGVALFYFSLALCGVLNSVISLFYYMKIARGMVFEERAENGALQFSFADKFFAVLLVVPVLLLLNFGPLLEILSKSFTTASVVLLAGVR